MSEFPSEITVVEVSQQPIELCKLLKIANMVGGGGEAKIVISEGYVALNGEVEFQKRKKVYHEDVIEFNGEIIQLLVSESLAELAPEAESFSTSKSQKPKKSQGKKVKSTNASNKQKKQKNKNAKPLSSKENKKQNPDQQNSDQQSMAEQTSGRKRRPISF